MKNTLNRLLAIGLFSPIAIFAAESAASPDVGQQANSVHIRSLAASCAACHGTNGNAAATGDTVTLAGLDKRYISDKLMAFKSGAANATVMHRHAKGLTDEEINSLAEYFSQQLGNAAVVLESQKLRDDHGH